MTEGLAALLGALVLLLVARLWHVARELSSSRRELAWVTTHESVTTSAAIGFATASDLDSLAEVAVEAAVSLAGSNLSWSVFMVPTGPTTIAAVGPAPYAVGELAPGELVGDWNGQDPADPVEISVGGLDGGHERTSSQHVVVPVLVGDQVRGRLVVGDATTDPDLLVPALRSVCLQLGAALHRAEAIEQRLQRNERRFRSLVQISSS